MISIANHKFSVPNKAGTVNFPQFNEGQEVTHEFDVQFVYNFNSTSTQQFIISSQSQITSLSIDLSKLGIEVGDSLKMEGTVSGGTDVDVTGTVLAVTSSTITFDSNIFLAANVSKIFPDYNNGEMFVTNQTRDTPISIDLFYNLIQNSNNTGTNLSLWDGEVNRFTGVLPVLVGGSSSIPQVGNKSGGTFISFDVEKLATTGKFTCTIVYLPWLGNEDIDFSIPSWYNSTEAVKPYIKVFGLTALGNPNTSINGDLVTLLGNTGWYDEAYNQGIDNFVIDTLTIKDSLGAVITNLNPSEVNTINVDIKSLTGTIDDSVCVNINTLFDFVESKNNPFRRIDNNVGCSVSDSGTILGSKNGAECTIVLVSSSASTDTLSLEFTITPNATFATYIDAQTTAQLHRVTVNVNDAITGQNVTKTLIEDVWITPPTPPQVFIANLINFYNHNLEIGDLPALRYTGTTEDDFLMDTKFDLDKNVDYENIKLTVNCVNNANTELIATLFERSFDLTNVVSVGGIMQINSVFPLTQFLDSPDRNQVSLKNTGVTDVDTYEVEMISSFMANWRDWVPVTNFLSYFYDNTLISNGQSAEWVNYLRLSGFKLQIRIDITDSSSSGKYMIVDIIDLLDYDEAETVTSSIEFINSGGFSVPEMISGQVYTIKATHTLSSGSWGEDGVWGWIGVRPYQSEEMKRISTAYDVTTQNLPLEPLFGGTRAELTYVSSTVVTVECKVNATLLTNKSTFVARINGEEFGQQMNVTKRDVDKFQPLRDGETTEEKDCCGDPWLVLADPSDSTTWKNDHTLIFEKCSDLNVFVVKDGVESPALGVVVTFPNDPTTKGFVIDWRLYYDLGNNLIQGDYDVYYEATLGGQTTRYFFNSYKLLLYTKDNAEGNIRISSIFNEYSDLYDVDFSGSGARDTVRLKGFFGYRQPNYKTKNNTELSKKRKNVFRKSNNVYSLIIEPTLECKTQRVEQIHLLHATECYISDFNRFNHYKEIKELPVILSDDNTPEFDYYEGIGTKYARVLAEFKDKVSKRKSKNNGLGENVDIPNIGLWEGVVCTGGGGDVEINKSNGSLIANVTAPAPYNVADSIISIAGGTINVLATEPQTIDIVGNTGLPVAATLSGSVVTIPSTPCPTDLTIDILFDAIDDTTCEIIIDALSAGSITAVTELGSSGTIFVLVENVVVTPPFTLAIGNKLQAYRTDTSVAGTIRLTGNY